MTSAHILVVDDYLVTQRILRQILQNAGYQVSLAGDGFEALEQIEAQSFDLVILDLAMPRLDGLEVLARVRASEQHHDLPIIMLTASGDDQMRETARKNGASAFLTKPSGSAEVIAAVRSLLT
jgi:CheY-like chemotaxis protein